VKIIEQISDFLNPLKVDISLYRAIFELVIAKIKGLIFPIRRQSLQKSEGFLGCADESEIRGMPRRRREHQKSSIFEHFKDALEELSAYLLRENPQKCVFEMQSNQRFDAVKMGHFHMKSELNRVFGDIGSGRSDKMNIRSMRSMEVLEEVLS